MTLKRRKPTKKMIEQSRIYIRKDSKELECKKCFTLVVNVNPDTKSVICSSCVQLMVGPPEGYNTEPKEKRPRGWQFKKWYVSPSGVTYSYGKETTDDYSEIVEQVEDSVERPKRKARAKAKKSSTKKSTKKSSTKKRTTSKKRS